MPVRGFPNPSLSIHFGDVYEANGREMPRQKQNAHACVSQDFVDVVNSRKLWFLKKTLVHIYGIGFEMSSECYS